MLYCCRNPERAVPIILIKDNGERIRWRGVGSFSLKFVFIWAFFVGIRLSHSLIILKILKVFQEIITLILRLSPL